MKLNETYGSPELCCWRVADDTVRLETRHPRHRQAIVDLAKRRGCAGVTPVGAGINHYRRLYDVRMNPEAARDWVLRRLKSAGRSPLPLVDAEAA